MNDHDHGDRGHLLMFDGFHSQKKSYDQPRQCIKKQKHHLANEGLSSQSYGSSSSHVWMWELDHKEGLSTEELILLNYDAGEDSWEFLGQGDQTSQS